MVKVKELNTTSTFAWAKSTRPLLATGTMSGAVNDTFSSDSFLSLYDLDLLNPSLDAEPKASIATDARFNAIDWSEPSSSMPLGIIAGAMDNGTVEFWDPSALINKNEASASIYKASNHSGNVKALQFHPTKKSLVASGGSKGEIFVWDTNNLTTDPIVPGKPSRLDEIQSLAWNNVVENILAYGSGFASIKDLRTKKDILHLHHGDESNTVISSIAWHPQNSTRLATALESDQSPLILVWDLRNSHSPYKVLNGHEKGVLSIDWCSKDADLLLSSAKDNKTLIWNPEQGEQLGEFSMAANWSFKVKFNPITPQVFASASFDGKISVRTLQDTSSNVPRDNTDVNGADGDTGTEFWNTIAETTNQGPQFSLQQTPKWLIPSGCVKFGFGGKIVTIKNTSDSTSTVSISKFVDDSQSQTDSTGFAKALKENDFKSIIDHRLKNNLIEDSKHDWEILSELLDTKDKKEYLKNKIGYEDTKQASALTSTSNDEKKETETVKEDDPFAPNKEDVDFFENLKESPEDQLDDLISDFKSFKLIDGTVGSETDRAISSAILVGDFDSAIDSLLKENRILDALVLALNGSASPKLKDRVLAAYFKSTIETVPFSRLVYTITHHKLQDLVANCDINDWKSCVVALSTFSKTEEEFKTYLAQIGDRILAEPNYTISSRNDAVLLYAVAGASKQLSDLWTKETVSYETKLLQSELSASPSAAHAEALEELIEKATVYRKLLGSETEVEPNSFDKLYHAYKEYADAVALQGELELANLFLNLLPSENAEVKLEKERIARASGIRPVVASTSSDRTSPIAKKSTRSTGPKTSYSRYNAPAQVSEFPAAQKAPSIPPQPTTVPSNPYQPISTANASNPYSVGNIPPSNNYQPPVTSSNPYQQPTKQAQYHQPPPPSGFSIVPPPSAINSINKPPGRPASASSHPPSFKKKDNGAGWNDLPNALPASNSRRATPAPAAVSVSTPASPPFAAGPTSHNGRHTPSIRPPPPTGGRAPSYNRERSGTETSQPVMPPPPVNPYAPPVQQPLQQFANQFNSPSSRYTPPPQTNPYGPRVASPINNYSAPQRTNSPYAPRRPSSSAGNAIGGGAYAPNGSNYQTGFSQAAPHPPPPGRSSVSRQSPPQNLNLKGYAPVVSAPPRSPIPQPGHIRQASIPRSVSPPPEPVKPKYPDGDRSHIPENALPIFHLLDAQLERIKPIIPEQHSRQLKDTERRLHILFDHLNNEDLLTHSTIQDLLTLVNELQVENFRDAKSIVLRISTDKTEECGKWMPGLRRLVDMVAACSQQ